MDVAALLERIEGLPDYAGQLAHVEVLPPSPGAYTEPARPLPAALQSLLAGRGLERLYTHQVAALDLARSGRDVVIVTGTASGKTLCYHLPILETVCQDNSATALYLFPTKALAQDQQRGLWELVGEGPIADRVCSGVYDGDTPPPQRRRIKAEANLILSNPDMLHASILPYHPKWARLFSELRYVVLDEVHTYRGILGAHVANLLRRLQRVCEHYGSRPTFLATSATVANPGELTSQLIGREVDVVDHDGSPRGRKYFVLWNPAPPGQDRLARRSTTDDAVLWMTEAIVSGGQALAFHRTRQATELTYRYVRQALEERHRSLADQICAYRGGYLPSERRKMEQDLFAGKIRGVAATNALELGIDVGSLDVTLLVNYPGTFASVWQQAGRSGRRQEESLSVLLAGNDPIDQYLIRHPEYFFAQPPEHAVVDPENSYVLAKHLKAAAFELPLDSEDTARFGALAAPVAELLHEEHELNRVADRYYFAGGQNPAVRISLRHMSDNTFSIVERRNGNHDVIANVDAISAPELVYPEAVYMHHSETYLVRELDLDGKVAYVERRETDYYTQAVLESHVAIQQEKQRSEAADTYDVSWGSVDVSWKTVAFKKIKFHTRESLGLGPVEIPEQHLATTATWLEPSGSVRAALKQARLRTSEGLCGIRNLALVGLPMVAMCDSRDISGVVDSKNLGRPTLILYDRYPGGLGYCEKGFHEIERLLAICHEMVVDCPCDDGCPSCVGLPNLRPAIHSDPDLSRGYPIPDKQATLELLGLLRCESAAQLAAG